MVNALTIWVGVSGEGELGVEISKSQNVAQARNER